MLPLTKGLNYRSAYDVTVPVTVQYHTHSHATAYLAVDCVFSPADQQTASMALLMWQTRTADETGRFGVSLATI